MKPGALFLALAAAAPGSTYSISLHTPTGTPWSSRSGPLAGPTVVIIGGLHGNEPAGAEAAEQIRHWPIARGTLAVLPRAHPAALAANRRSMPPDDGAHPDLNRCFPTADLPSPRGELATALWEAIRARQPDWVVDLHEGVGVYGTNPASVGSTILAAPSADARAAATSVWRSVNATITNDRLRFRLIGPPITGSLARAAHDVLGARSLIFETTSRGQPLSRRIRQHRVMVHALLDHLGMIDASVTPDRLLPPPDARRRVALYDAEGVGGAGPGRVADLLRRCNADLVIPVSPEDIRSGALAGFDAVVFSGGSGSRQAAALGEDGRAAVRAFVENGGGYLGLCAGAYLALDGYPWGLGVVTGSTASPLWRRGTGSVPIEFTSAGRDILAVAGGTQAVRYANGPVLAPVTGSVPYQVLAFFRGELASNNTPPGAMSNSPAIVSAMCGRGRVIWCSPHPEQTAPLEETIPAALRWLAPSRAAPPGSSHRPVAFDLVPHRPAARSDGP